jgi:cell wall-associated NlpC family hydrolase
LGNEVVLQALSLLGVPYRFGGNDPATGLDCSGLVRHVFRAAKGVDLPRRSVEIGKVGRAIKRDELVPGDLVFFNTRGAPYSHVAIYIGDGNFVHAPARRGQVRIEALNERYWQRRFNGARRIGDDADVPVARNASSLSTARRASEPLAVDGPVQ